MKNKSAFTLLELLVAMAIIAVLLALAVFGILQVQKNSRETQRRKALEDVNIGIQDFYSRYGQYPAVVVFESEQAKICDDFSCTQQETVPLRGSARSNGSNPTTTNGTEYAYQLQSDGYQLGFCREDGEVENAGTSKDEFTGTAAPLNCTD